MSLDIMSGATGSRIADGRAAIRTGAAHGLLAYRECRRLRTETEDFRYAWSLAEDVVGMITRAEADLLHELATTVQRHTYIVEIGSFLGRSTIVLGVAARRAGARVAAVDPHTGDRAWVEDMGVASIDTSSKWRDNLRKSGVEDVVVPMIMPSSEAAAAWPFGTSVSLLFVDGWHSTSAVRGDVLAWRSHLSPDAVVVFDDAPHPEVGAALDLEEVRASLPPYRGWLGKMALFASQAALERASRLAGMIIQRPIGRLRVGLSSKPLRAW